LANGGKLIFKTMGKIVKIFVILAIVLLLIIVLGNYLLQRQLGQVGGVDFSEITSQLEGLSPEQILKSQREKENDKRFVSPDKKLKIEYSLRWIETPSESLERIVPKERTQKYKLTNLLLAQRFEISGEFAQLIVAQAFFDAQKSFEQIINEMQETNLEQGWNMEIVESKTENNQIAFEARYQRAKDYSVYSKEKIIFLEPETDSKKAYFISCIVLEKDWPKFKQEVNEIFDSVEINE